MIALRTALRAFAVAAALWAMAGTGRAAAPDPLGKPPAWQPRPLQDVKAQAFARLQEKKADATAMAKATALWAALGEKPGEVELLDCLAKTFALADPGAAKLVELCAQPRKELLLPSQAWLSDPKTSPFVGQNMRVFYARWLVHQSLFDEAIEALSGLKPEDVVAPATLLFYQSVAHHTLLDQEAGLKSIEQLLSGGDAGPRRYVALARLMQDDLSSLKDDTDLGHIARRMDDIRRRLDLGRAGPKVRGIEVGVIESLDKLIKKLEEQQQQSGGGGGGSNIRSSSPAPDSMIIGGKGQGDVAKRNIGSKSGWGDLPPKQREEALQRISRDFPAHYRDVIEQYFRRLAAEGSE